MQCERLNFISDNFLIFLNIACCPNWAACPYLIFITDIWSPPFNTKSTQSSCPVSWRTFHWAVMEPIFHRGRYLEMDSKFASCPSPEVRLFLECIIVLPSLPRPERIPDTWLKFVRKSNVFSESVHYVLQMERHQSRLNLTWFFCNIYNSVIRSWTPQ